MECWVHQDIILQDDKANQSLKEAWEQEDKKDEFKIDLHGHERFWLGTEAGHLGCYDFPGETWAGDGSAHKGGVGAGSVCLQQQDKCLVTGPSGPRRGGSQLTTARLAAVARTLQATPPGINLLYLCDSETTLDKVSRWIGRGPRTTLAGDANADIMKTIIECLR
jgi:hypothetical protein